MMTARSGKRWTIGAVLAAVAVAPLLASGAAAFGADTAVYELRTYRTNEGRLDALNARFRDHTMQIFAKHGIESVAYWTPMDEPDSANTLIYLIRHKSREAADASWKAFGADPEWKEVAQKSEADGKILSERPERIYMTLNDYSPAVTTGEASAEPRVFELRIYTAAEGKLDAINARFRDHTDGIFGKHGMKAFGYWTPTDEPKKGNTLIYVLEHASREAAAKSWKAFSADPEWQAVAKETQKDGRLLAGRPVSIYMSPTDYSPRK